MVVPAGDNSGVFASGLPAGTTYWFAAGDHTIGTSPYSQITPGPGDVFLGAPGAILDGQWMARVSIGSILTERQHVEALWALIREAVKPTTERRPEGAV